MLDALRSILDTIGVLVSLLVSIVTSLVNFILKMPTYIQFLTALLGISPTFVYQFAITGISISVVLWLINKKSSQGGSN